MRWTGTTRTHVSKTGVGRPRHTRIASQRLGEKMKDANKAAKGKRIGETSNRDAGHERGDERTLGNTGR